MHIIPCPRSGTGGDVGAPSNKDSGGIHINFHEGRVDVSQEAVNQIAQSWQATLNWGSDHPILFVILLCVVVVIVREIRIGKRDQRAMKAEYDAMRKKSRNAPVQQELKLPHPREAKKLRGRDD